MTSVEGKSFDLGPGSNKMTATISDTGSPFRVVSNLWQPAQKLAYEAQRFEMEKIFAGLKVGSLTLPLNVNIELTGQLSSNDQKHLSVKFMLDSSTELAGVDKKGFHPCRVGFGIRKGIQQGPRNVSFLSFDFNDFNAIVNHMRGLFEKACEIVQSEKTFNSALEAGLPIHKIVKEIPGADSKLLVVSLNVLNRAAESEATPVLSIREYYEDVANSCFQPSLRGVTMALNASYMFMFPVPHAISVIHDSIMNVKIAFSEHEAKIREILLELEPLIESGNTNDLQDDLKKYEAMVIARENGENREESSINEDFEIDIESVNDLE